MDNFDTLDNLETLDSWDTLDTSVSAVDLYYVP
jgi:hypothetical protein